MIYMKCYINCTPEDLDTAGAVLVANDIAGYIVNDPNNLEYLYDKDSAHWDYIDEDMKISIASLCNVEFYLPDDEQGKSILNKIRDHLEILDNSEKYRLGVAEVDDSTWINKWKEFFKPLKIGERYYIKPSWEEIKETHNRCVIEIDPENSFGSGTHATTQLCLLEIEKYCNSSSTVLDLGCGSGILGIGCKLLGCDSVMFVDIDNHCIETAKKNTASNNLSFDNMQYEYGNILEDNVLCNTIGRKKYDIVLVNIMADIIIAMAPMIDKFMAKDGKAIFSGIITQRLDDVVSALEEYNYKIVDINTIDNWCSVTATI